MTWINQDAEALLKAILSLKNRSEAESFLRDLLTASEIKEFAQRFKVAQLLDEGVSYLEIEKQTGMSSTTIARVQKWLKKGMGGYQFMLDRLSSTHHSHSPSLREEGLG